MKKSASLCLISLLLNLRLPQVAQAQHVNGVKAALVCIPGLTQSSRTYRKLAERISPYGFTTCALDIKGFVTPESSDRQEKIDFDQTVEQVKEASMHLKQKNPDMPVFVLGESTGGTIALRVAALYPQYIDGIICSVPTWKVRGRNKIAFYEFLDLTFLRARRHGLAVNTVINLTTEDQKLRDELTQTESRRQRFSICEALKFMRFIKASPRTAAQIEDVPVLMVQGLKDKLSAPKGSAVLFNKLGTNSKTFVLDACAEHLICEEGRFSSQLLLTITDWMAKVMAGEAPLKPQAILISEDKLAQNDSDLVRKVFISAGVSPDTVVAQDNVEKIGAYSQD